ncbi:hypothetical protein IGI04_006039, partial [Brassica rapa subsp. trilocularis]
MATTVAGLSPVIAPIYSPITNRKPISFYKPHLLSYKQSPISSLHSSRTARVIELTRKQRNRRTKGFLRGSSMKLGLNGGQVASVDIKLPRRSLLVEFSCNSCGERTKRLINQLAYERGLVFVQNVQELRRDKTKESHLCGGCLQHHQLVDNLGLIVEYDF